MDKRESLLAISRMEIIRFETWTSWMSDGEAISDSVESCNGHLAKCWKTMAVINEAYVKPEWNLGKTNKRSTCVAILVCTTRINGFSKDEEVRIVECFVINALHVSIHSNVDKKMNELRTFLYVI